MSPTVENPQVLPETTPPSPRPNKIISIAASILLLLLIGSTVFLGYQNWQLRKQLQTPTTYEECIAAPSSHIQESYPSVCVTSDGKSFTQPLTDEEKKNLQPPDDTTNWKTYTNKTYGFTLQYPTNWKIKEGSGTEATTLTSPETQQIMDANSKLKTQQGFIYVQADIAMRVEPVASQQDSGSNTLYLVRSGQINDPLWATIISREKINNQTFILAKIAADPPYLAYFTQNKNFLYSIDLGNAQTPTSITGTEKQLLSTFTFLDTQGNSGEPCGGIAGKLCPDGDKCQMTAMYPDAMGTCVTDAPNAGYTCPANGYVDCMPIMDEAKKKACSAEAMTWYKVNCPNFKGGAL